jgi:type II secretory pathway predicted ATPase ExeA
MYVQFFGFGKLPFRLRPDAEFLLPSEEYLEARGLTLAALRAHARLVLILGQPGVGKTLLLADVLDAVGGEFNACRVNQPQISATELLQALLLQIGARNADRDAHHSRLLLELTTGLNAAAGRGAVRPLLIIDDAQLLAAATLHTLGEILADAPRLQILLAGQDDQGQRDVDLAARIAVVQKPRQVRLSPLDANGTKAYVEHRLRVAGGGGTRVVFTSDAYEMLFRKTGGIPRRISTVCDAALRAAYRRASRRVDAAGILAATQDSPAPEAAAPDKARPSAPASQPREQFSQQSTADAGSPGAAASDAGSPGAAASDAGSPGAAASDAAMLRTARLVVSRRKQHVMTWPLQPGRISIGRASDNELRLDASFVSRHHCQVVTDGTVATIEDLGSVNGITVNGKPVKRHVLENSDQVMIGDHVITYVVG